MSINRFDYSDPKVMAWRAEVQAARRGGAAPEQLHPYVIGRFVLDQGRVVLAALEQVAFTVGERLTVECGRFYRWRTRQGAHQWKQNNRRAADLSVWFLDRLDVAALGALTNGQLEEQRYRAAEARALEAGDVARVERLKAARETIDRYHPAAVAIEGSIDVDTPSTSLEVFPDVKAAAAWLARTPDDEDWILRLPLTYRNCVRAAEQRINGSGGAEREKLEAAKAILNRFYAERVKR